MDVRTVSGPPVCGANDVQVPGYRGRNAAGPTNQERLVEAELVVIDSLEVVPKRRLKELDVSIGLVGVLRTCLTFKFVRRAIRWGGPVTHQFHKKEIKESFCEGVRHGLGSMVSS